jgi:hypothetical protein
MNTLNKALLLGFSVGLFHSVYADTSNERGEDRLQQVSLDVRPIAYQRDYSITSSLGGFNEKTEFIFCSCTNTGGEVTWSPPGCPPANVPRTPCPPW